MKKIFVCVDVLVWLVGGGAVLQLAQPTLVAMDPWNPWKTLETLENRFISGKSWRKKMTPGNILKFALNIFYALNEFQTLSMVAF